MLTGNHILFFACAMGVILATTGCSGGDTQMSVKYASDYVQSNASVSVFGVFENGRLSPESWKEIGPDLSSRFARGTCETAWGDSVFNANPTLTSAIDEYTKDEGVTDDILQRLAPMAKGDAILTFTVLGRRLTKGNEGDTKSSKAKPSSPVSIGGGRGMGGMGGRQQPRASADQHGAAARKTYDISASFFSNRLRHSIGVVSMSYSGTDTDAALQEFANKLRSSIPNVTCAGWNLAAHVDVGQVRELLKQAATEPAD